jgi:nucleoside-diphosphate-sugar epimerase
MILATSGQHSCNTRTEFLLFTDKIPELHRYYTYAEETGTKVAVYRFLNLMGHSRPKYNSTVSTFCWAVANEEEFTVNDRSTELELLYIDDLV